MATDSQSPLTPIANVGSQGECAAMTGHLKIEPMYGFGWSAAGLPGTRDTPAPFSIRLTHSTDGEWNGKVETPGHEFQGRNVCLTQRHRDFDGIVNVVVVGAATGFAAIV